VQNGMPISPSDSQVEVTTSLSKPATNFIPKKNEAHAQPKLSNQQKKAEKKTPDTRHVKLKKKTESYSRVLNNDIKVLEALL